MGVNVGGQISTSFAGTVDEIRGINVGIGSPSGLVDDKYGLYVQNITNGNNSNYAIYTNNGDVRLGDLTNTETLAGTDNLVVADTDGVLKAVPATSLGGEWEDDGAGGIRAVQANASGNTFAFKDDGDIFVGRNGFDLADKENIVTEFRASTDNLDPASTQEAQFFTTRSRVKQSSVNGAIAGRLLN